MLYKGIVYTVDSMEINYKFISLAALLLLLGFGAGYFLSSEPVDIYQNPDLSLPVDPDCVLNEAPCERDIGTGGSLMFSIGPRPILGASPLKFELSTQDLEVQSAVVG